MREMQFSVIVLMILMCSALILLLPERVRYDKVTNRSRWLMVGALGVIGVQFLVQYVTELRTMGVTQAVLANLVFFVPASGLMSLTVLNLQRQGRLNSIERWLWVAVALLVTTVLVVTVWTDDSPISRLSERVYIAEVVMSVIYASMQAFYSVMQFVELKRMQTAIEDYYGSERKELTQWMKHAVAITGLMAMFVPLLIFGPNIVLIVYGLTFFWGIFLMWFCFVRYFTSNDMKRVREAEASAEESDREEQADVQMTEGDRLPPETMQLVDNAVEHWLATKTYLQAGITSPAAADAMDIPRYQLTAWVKASGHKSFTHWITMLRIEEAKRMLQEHPDWSNEAVADHCGFSRTHFQRMFKQETGVAPSEFHLLLVAVLAACLMACTSSNKRINMNASHTDSVIFAAGAKMHYDQMLELVDSFELTGDITPLNANRWRGVVYYHQNQYRLAENYYRRAIKEEVKSDADQLCYNKVARRLSELLLVKGDYEGALQVAVPAVEKMQKSGIGSDIDYAILLNNIGCCQLNLGQDEEANKSFLTARGHYANRWQSDSTSRGFQEAVLGTVYTSMAYINTRRYEESIYWIDRTEMLLNKYRQYSDARVEYFDEYQGRIEIMRAVALEGLGKTAEAAQAYREFQKTQYAKTAAGRINANDYLVVAGRYREAADNYRYLDQTIGERGLEPSLDNIQLYLLPKYHANAKAARGDTAMAIGQFIMGLLDSSITVYKNSTTAELATIYDTNQKEAEIVKQREDMTRMRFVSVLTALGLILIFLLIYTWIRRKAAHRLRAAHEKLEDAHMRLEDAHAKLQTAYDQLESTTKAKERIESELRIARNIQASMVPNIFPNREGLDLYASMTPAREVGGDLYGFLLIEDDLYICVGDVSGKGVPASLFMAQATRLFRILATQHMMPNEIATRMNSVLTESNEQGMFVTMFIGLVHLKTGRLDYCNAGHNPPVLGVDGHDKFMEMETNAPIGLWPDLDFVGEYVDDIRGQMLLVYTDGLNEAENRQQEQFGDDRLLDILNHRHFNSCQELVEHLNAEVISHRNGADPNDDLTMLCLMID